MLSDAGFLEAYEKLKQQVLFFEFENIPTELSDELIKLYQKAHSIQTQIIATRKIGAEFRYASLTYFACIQAESISMDAYLILQASYAIDTCYKQLKQIEGSENKQKQVYDLHRYISRYLLEIQPNTAPYRSESIQALKFLVKFIRDLTCNTENNKTELWNKIYSIDGFTHIDIKNYIHSFEIILKNIDTGRITHRSRLSKRTGKLSWATPAQKSRYSSRTTTSTIDLGYGATLDIPPPGVIIDEDGEVDIEEEAVEYYAQDIDTQEFQKQIVTPYIEEIAKHRQRRLLPFISNPYYIEPQALARIIELFSQKLQTDTKEGQMSAACLLSLVTGLPPIELLNYRNLIKQGVLSELKQNKKTIYLLNLELNISQQKINILKNHRINDDISHQLYLPAAWFEYLPQDTNNISIQDIKKYLKNVTKNQFVGHLTIEKLQAQIYFHIRYQTFNEYLAHLVAGKDAKHNLPGMYYGGIPKTTVNEAYLCYLKTVFNDAEFLDDKELTQEYKILEKRFAENPPKQNERLGSQLALSKDFVAEIFSVLHHHCQKNIQVSQHPIKQINAYACWMWHLNLLCLTRRPQENLLGNPEDYLSELQFTYINDKKNSKSRKDGRFIPIPPFFDKALQNYQSFLSDLMQRYKALFTRISVLAKVNESHLFGSIIKSPKILPISLNEWKKVKLEPLSRNWIKSYMEEVLPKNMYANWLRHFGMNMLMKNSCGASNNLSFHFIQALYGHDQRDQEIFHPHSSTVPHTYLTEVIEKMEKVIAELHIQHLVRK